ncbi:MAG: 3-demethylubiquinone-9 3-methyltransferase [Nitrospira sp.]|nr:MAG: 3-demethylubiquinone-9 3-methyltransferase [Nitrospira sp.]
MTATSSDCGGYDYSDAGLNASHVYLIPAVVKILSTLNSTKEEKRIFELGCGNGSVSNELTKGGFEITGVDPSPDGVRNAKEHYPHLKIFSGSAYDDLAHRYGKFPIVLSLEVVEHLYFPRKFAAVVSDLLLPGGTAIISTPYHGSWKNLALSLTGKMDDHFTALWDYGHIKFWSMSTLRTLLKEMGFEDISFVRIGRIPMLAKSMIAIARKPQQ